ncbi:MATE family efflux transporter [Pontibacillus litoralis]|uniref:Multidrug export protein MepA n=1 Tax=Pontibacillus litoralis JSM 072002 TaxID=1385512 RepID=A0A0A5G390_9BACI|nr:MATE family efflux transporter [Pontibacillus litoralis]KGX87576.1 multidrug transporter MatE [Pontibacillus litoralis JSM 072002]
MSNLEHKLMQQPVHKVFLQYLIPSLIGMMLMSVNILIDGIFVGNGVGEVALAAVNIAVPVFSIIISISLWIGIGGGALYSMALGENKLHKARKLFTQAMVLVTVIISFISLIGLWKVESLALILGANEDTLTYVVDYLRILIGFGVFMGLENALSIFVRNDGNPTLAMVSLIITSLSNIILNYLFIFLLNLGVTGAALATIIASVIGFIVLLTHFMKQERTLNLVSISFDWYSFKNIFTIGFPSFLAEIGALVFVIGYNLRMVNIVGTEGVAAFSVVNYLHAFMFLAFIGIGSTIQPMISFYYGANEKARMKETLKISERAALFLGALFFIVGFIFAPTLVSLFGIASSDIQAMAVKGIRLFFLGYIYMGINFIYTTYFQSIGQVRPSVMIILVRGYVLLFVALWLLPQWLGIVGIWISLPVAEAVVALCLFVFVRKRVIKVKTPITNS